MLTFQSCSQDRNPDFGQFPAAAAFCSPEPYKKNKNPCKLPWGNYQKDGFLAACGGFPGNLICFRPSPARPGDTVSDRKCLNQTRSKNLFPSHPHPLKGHKSFWTVPIMTCISSCNSFQYHWDKNTPVFQLRHF